MCPLQVALQQRKPDRWLRAVATKHQAAVRVECMEQMQLRMQMWCSKANSTDRGHQDQNRQ